MCCWLIFKFEVKALNNSAQFNVHLPSTDFISLNSELKFSISLYYLNRLLYVT